MIHLPTLTPLEHTGFIATGLLVYVLVTRARRQQRPAFAAMAWVISIIAFPYLALPLFLLFGTRKLVRPARRGIETPQHPENPAAPAWCTRLLSALGVAEAAANKDIEFQADGTASLAALCDVIDAAQQTLDICTYVLGDDATGTLLVDRMIARAHAGVKVRLLVDAAGSLRTAHAHDARLRDAGIDKRLFMPILGSPRRQGINLRNHRKITLADGCVLWSGGRNLADEYFIDRAGTPAWIDLSFRARGALAERAQASFELNWQVARGQTVAPPSHAGAGRIENAADTTPTLAQWVPSGPEFHDDTLHALLLSACFHAEQRLFLATPYFVPGDALLQALLLATRRGVRLLLLVPARSNHGLADWARGRALRELAAAGAQVCLLPHMLHAKAAVVDDTLALCGSANLDNRSLFLNYEAMAAFYDARQIDWLADWFETTARTGAPASAQTPGWLRDLAEGVVGAVAFQL